MSTVLALDVSKGKSYYVIYNGNNCLYEGEIFHTKEGFENLLAQIYILDEIPEVVFEATGVYSCPVEAFCQRNLLTYYVLNPFQAKNQMEKETLRKWKTDKFDAHRLAQTHGSKTS